jgi:hypothetical protein
MINLTQWLCPQRHCLIAFAWDPEKNSEKEMMEKGESLFTKIDSLQFTVGGQALPPQPRTGSNRFCGVCSSKEIHVETIQTKFKTVEGAAPALRNLQQANLLAMRILQKGNN